jgi:hypothetical protein
MLWLRHATSMWSSSSGYHGRRAANSESVVRLLTTEPSRESQLPDLTKSCQDGRAPESFHRTCRISESNRERPNNRTKCMKAKFPRAELC